MSRNNGQIPGESKSQNKAESINLDSEYKCKETQAQRDEKPQNYTKRTHQEIICVS